VHTPDRACLPEVSIPVRVIWSVEAIGKRVWTYDPVIPVYSSELFSYFLCSIGAGVINNDDLPIEVAVQTCTEAILERRIRRTILERFLLGARRRLEGSCVRCKLEG
jgi:hypothetical protein